MEPPVSQASLTLTNAESEKNLFALCFQWEGESIFPRSQINSVTKGKFCKTAGQPSKPQQPQTTGAYSDICLVEPLGILQ